MPLDDPRRVRSLADAFDLTTPQVQLWELDLIWRAVDEGLIRSDEHGDQAALDESIMLPDICRVIISGRPRSKDIGYRERRRIGINFEGKISGGRTIRVKVSWFVGYVIVTAHTL